MPPGSVLRKRPPIGCHCVRPNACMFPPVQATPQARCGLAYLPVIVSSMSTLPRQKHAVSPVCGRAPVRDLKLLCMGTSEERKSLTLLSSSFVVQNYIHARSVFLPTLRDRPTGGRDGAVSRRALVSTYSVIQS